MKKANQDIRLMIVMMIVLCMPLLSIAQLPPDPGGSPDVPIDGGLSVLLAAGAGYIVKKGYDARKKKQENNKA